MKSRYLFLILVVGLIVIFALASPNSEEPVPIDFCDTILTFDDDVNDQCSDRFYWDMADVCAITDPDTDEETCVLSTIAAIWQVCLDYEEEFDVPQDICLYGQAKNFKKDFEKWEKNN